MNKALLSWTHQNLHDWLKRDREETVTDKQKLNVIMLSLADICSSLAFATEDEREAYQHPKEPDDPN